MEGDPTEGALIVSAMKAGYDPRVLEQEMPRLDTIPFESARQYMATLHDQGEGKAQIASCQRIHRKHLCGMCYNHGTGRRT